MDARTRLMLRGRGASKKSARQRGFIKGTSAAIAAPLARPYAGSGRPVVDDEGRTCITKSQRRLHELGELGGILVAAPLLAYVATRKRPLSTNEKRALMTVAGVTFAVDAVLLRNYRRRKKHA